MRVLFLITARGGSKGIPGKNLLQIKGISLVGFKAISARNCRCCARLIISTDSQAIQADAAKYGVEVPFTRPAVLAADDSSTEDVVWHAMRYIETETNERYDAVMVLEPTSPFATHLDYDKAIEVMIQNRANVVVGMKEVVVNSVFQGPMDERGRISSIVQKVSRLQSVRRQDLPQDYTMNGAFYLLKWEFFKKHRKRYCDPDNTYGLVMRPAYSVEIDELIDWEWAQFLVEKGRVDLSYWSTSVEGITAQA